MTTGRHELLESRDLALRDLADLERQELEGEIDPVTAERLRARYEADAVAALEALAAFDDRSAGSRPTSPAGSRRQRWMVGIALTALGVAAAGLLLPRYLTDRPAGGFVTGNEAAGGGRDVSTVTNDELEQVVADNPDVVGMRLALAERYLVAAEFRKALDHYQQVLDREPHPEALAGVGWILFQTTDEYAIAEKYVMESLEKAPGDRLALWFLANIRLSGTDDPAGAATIARQLLARDDLSDAERQAIQALLDEAQSAEGGER